jgi:small neutral amino acid transporter SnatA (MarC family)
MTILQQERLMADCSHSNPVLHRQAPTHRSRKWISLRPTGLPWNLTFANATGKVRDGDSSRSRSASIDFVGSAVTTAALAGITLFLAIAIDRLLGRTGINVATRVIALFVAAVGVHFIITVCAVSCLAFFIELGIG